jgi:hypothetical protein
LHHNQLEPVQAEYDNGKSFIRGELSAALVDFPRYRVTGLHRFDMFETPVWEPTLPHSSRHPDALCSALTLTEIKSASDERGYPGYPFWRIL